MSAAETLNLNGPPAVLRFPAGSKTRKRGGRPHNGKPGVFDPQKAGKIPRKTTFLNHSPIFCFSLLDTKPESDTLHESFVAVGHGQLFTDDVFVL